MSRVDLPGGDWAELAERLNYAQSRRIMAARGTVDAAGTLVAALVTGWQIRAVDGTPIGFPELRPEGIPLAALDLLPWDVFEAIGLAAAEIVGGEPDPKGSAGTSPGSASPDNRSPSTGTSPTPTSSPITPAGAGAT